MKLCLINLTTKLVGVFLSLWWILLVIGMQALTKYLLTANWEIICGLIGGWLFVGVISVISSILGWAMLMGNLEKNL